MGSKVKQDELGKIKQTLQEICQYRYAWIMSHICRGIILNEVDNNFNGLTQNITGYHFSAQEKNDYDPIKTCNYFELLKLSGKPFAYGDTKSTVFDGKYTREAWLTALRRSLLINIQSTLEFYKIDSIYKQTNFACYNNKKDIFAFIRHARNIICHNKGSMDSDRIPRKGCVWNGIAIKRSSKILKLSDRLLLELIDDVIGFLIPPIIDMENELDYIIMHYAHDHSKVKCFLKRELEQLNQANTKENFGN